MNAPTDTATLQEPTDRAEIHGGGTVIVEYTKTEAALADLRARYKGVAFDLTTTKGDKEARAARLELVTLRTSLEKKRKTFKIPAIEFGKKIDAEAQRITAEIEALEKPIDDQIRADEARREAEKEAKRQAEAARVQNHLAAIGKIRNWVTMAEGLPSERLAKGVGALEAMAFGDECEDHKPQYEAARNETLATLRKMHADTLAREEEAKRLEAQRQEQERVAAELAEQQAEINRQRAELERRQREIIEAAEAERLEQARKEQARADASAAIQREAERQSIATWGGPEKISADTSEAAPNGTGETPAPSQRETPPSGLRPDGSLKPVITIELEDAPPPPFAEPAPIPTLKLGEIQARLGFDGEPLKVTGEFLSRLGFEATRIKSASLYQEADFARICAALINHLGRLA